MLDGYSLEVALTASNAAAQAWYGYEQGVVSGILISPDFVEVFPQTKVSSIQGITASCFSLGNLVGCLLAACYGNRLGRKNTLRLGAAINAIGGVLQFSACSFAQLIVGRVVNGIGNGVTSSTCGVFQAESCRSDRRGKLSVIVEDINGDSLWQYRYFQDTGRGSLMETNFWCVASKLVPCIALVSLLPLVPDSPRWLLMQGKNKEGLEAIRRYLGKGLSIDDSIVQSEYHSITGALLIERCGGQFMQQFGGINALNYYFTIILINNIGMDELMARILTGCNATSYMISSGLCFWLIERCGRRVLMLSGLSLQCFAYIMVAISIALLGSAPFQWGIVAVSFLFFYYAAFGCTWGMVPWVYQAEINSLSMRSVEAAAATATNWLAGFICTQFTPTGIANIGYRFYIIFAVFNLTFIFVCYFLYPETAYRTLEDLDVYFDRDSNHPTIIPIHDKVSKQSKRPLEAIEAEAVRVAATKAVGAKGVTEHVEDIDGTV
ncbi:hypothetical protein N7450_002988 [Penicillium hetheringtonii]|uniref:Major facilitator superfamily (MFS) profile domain-containing protein n=1 Tax=Penicillium hetheringtonii TaxID=911720 RepID=A0AAD6GZ72_9EURO|nr:hypothetical protein N7450_002988 [Penicillium hetheringtonii]